MRTRPLSFCHVESRFPVHFVAVLSTSRTFPQVNMKLQIVPLLALFVVAFAEEIAEEEGVLVLKTSNFDQALKDNQYILVEFCEYRYFFSFAVR